MTAPVACGRPRRLQADALDLRLHEWGAEGSPGVLLLHSLAAHGHWWDGVAAQLRDRHHVIALDLRGHGGSEWAPAAEGGAGYAFDDYVGDIVAVLDLLGWQAPIVIGHSLGGYLAAQLAATHPDRVSAVVVADILTAASDDMLAQAVRNAARPAPRFATAAEAAARFRLSPPDTVASADLLQHLGATSVIERGPGVWEHAFDRRVFLHPRPDPWGFLPRVACPMLVIRGESSPVMTREAAERVAGTVRHGTVVELRNAFHHLIVDDPAGFAERVEGWLAALPRGGPSAG